MVISDFVHISTPVALGMIAGILVLTMLASYVAERLQYQTGGAGIDSPAVPDDALCDIKDTADGNKERK